MTERVGRLLTFGLIDAAENMAIDQAVLESVGRGGPTTLRFYGWSEPTLSLGYFQAAADRSRHPASESLRCVRRATGGGAIVHDRELTYSLSLAADDDRLGGNEDLYRAVHGAVARYLCRRGVRVQAYRQSGSSLEVGDEVFLMRDRRSQRGGAAQREPFLCFQRRTAEDLVCAGYKVLGSAQRKLRGAIMQHGSLLLRASRWSPQLPGIWQLTGVDLSPRSLARELATAFAEVIGVPGWQESDLTAAERGRAGQLVQERYGDRQWLAKR